MRRRDGSRRLARGRDYSFAAGRLRSIQGVVDGVRVTVWAARAKRSRKLAGVLRTARPARAAERAVRALRLARSPDRRHAGRRDGAHRADHDSARDFIVTHELAHEWWYALIGSDQAAAPWLDEAFATYAEEAAGPDGRPWCRRPGRSVGLVTRGTAYFRRHRYRGYDAIYVEGACLLDLLRERMGHATFTAALRGYALANRYGWSTASEFRAAMDAASPVPLDDLWRRYRVQ